MFESEFESESLSDPGALTPQPVSEAATADTPSAMVEAPLSPDAVLIRVAATFVCLVALLETAGWFIGYHGYFVPLCNATATATGAFSNLTGVPATVSGSYIFLATRTLRIGIHCTAISLANVYTALVVAYPLSWKRKAIGLVVGLPVIAAANFVRLAAVVQLSAPLGDRAFLFFHDYLFQIIMLGVVLLLWGFYLASARRHAS